VSGVSLGPVGRHIAGKIKAIAIAVGLSVSALQRRVDVFDIFSTQANVECALIMRRTLGGGIPAIPKVDVPGLRLR
jgi:hypothetical protein